MTLAFKTITREEALVLILRGMEAKRAEIDAALHDLRSQLEPHWTVRRLQEHGAQQPKRHTMSAAGRRAISRAQKARWAKLKRKVA